jgi:vacuolar iron transporter family protein
MLKQNRVEKAQEAYRNKDLNATKRAHTKEAIEHKETHQKEKGKYIGDFVYGALDGIITTFAVVSGVQGAQMNNSVVLIMGFANLLADGISMGVGNYLSTKSELEYIKKEREREEWEIEHYPDGEREEIRHIFKKKGFIGKDLDRAVKVITSDKKIWVDTMMLDELGLTVEDKTPVMSGFATFISFLIAGFIPLLIYVVSFFIPLFSANLFFVSIVLTALTLFGVGAIRSVITGTKWIRSGLEMLLMGGLAATVAYWIGFFLRRIIG